jgi:hypothetical protein
MLCVREFEWFTDAFGETSELLPSAFFCPDCGEIWGRRLIVHRYKLFWNVKVRFCAAHGEGSFIESAFEWENLLSGKVEFPPPWLDHEFKVAIGYFKEN